MSRAISFRSFIPLLPSIRQRLKHIKQARAKREWSHADAIRDSILALDNGMKITVTKENKVSLWHFPNPPFFDQLHYCNYGEFITNSEET